MKIDNKISIIIPVFNCEKYISACIDSVMNQTYTNYEIIIINDGSTDGSLVRCNKYKDNYKVKIFDKKNTGVSDTRNFGINNSTGKYIIFLDSDDILPINYLQVLISIIEKNNSDIVICGINYKKGGVNEIFQVKGQVKSITEFAEDFYYFYNKGIIASPCNKIYKKSLIDEKRINFDENISYGEDLIFNLEYLLLCNEVEFTDKTNYNYCLHENDSLSQRYRDSLILDNLKTIEFLGKFFSDTKSLNEKNNFFLEELYFQVVLSTLLILINSPERKKYSKYNEILSNIDYHQLKTPTSFMRKIVYYPLKYRLRVTTYLVLYIHKIINKIRNLKVIKGNG